MANSGSLADLALRSLHRDWAWNWILVNPGTSFEFIVTHIDEIKRKLLGAATNERARTIWRIEISSSISKNPNLTAEHIEANFS